ncbi:MAG: OsmC family protein [Bacteroidota bacterium]
MVRHKTTAVHKGKMAFDAKINNHAVVVDTVEAGGGDNTGPNAKPLMLVALAGCVGMEMVPILNKMRMEFSDFSVEADAELTDEHPRVYASIKLIVTIKIDESNRARFENALHLSLDKYCGVYAMMSKVAPITKEIVYL